MVRAVLYGYFLLFCSLRSDGQSISSRQHSQYLTTVPFQVLSGGVVLISAKLDDHTTPLHFILDSGSGGISIDSTKANALGLHLEYPEKNIVGIGGFSQTAVSYNHSIGFEQLSISNLSFHVYNYQLLSAIYGVQIDGVIGYPVLSRYVVQLNYENLVMDIFSAGEFTYPKKGSLFTWKGNGIPQHEVSFMKGKSVKKPLYFDTGAGLAVLLNEDFALESGILNKKRKLFTTRAEGIGGKKLMQITVVKKIKLGPFVFRDVPTYIFSDEIGVTGYPLLGG